MGLVDADSLILFDGLDWINGHILRQTLRLAFLFGCSNRVEEEELCMKREFDSVMFGLIPLLCYFVYS